MLKHSLKLWSASQLPREQFSWWKDVLKKVYGEKKFKTSHSSYSIYTTLDVQFTYLPQHDSAQTHMVQGSVTDTTVVWTSEHVDVQLTNTLRVVDPSSPQRERTLDVGGSQHVCDL